MLYKQQQQRWGTTTFYDKKTIGGFIQMWKIIKTTQRDHKKRAMDDDNDNDDGLGV